MAASDPSSPEHRIYINGELSDSSPGRPQGLRSSSSPVSIGSKRMGTPQDTTEASDLGNLNGRGNRHRYRLADNDRPRSHRIVPRNRLRRDRRSRRLAPRTDPAGSGQPLHGRTQRTEFRRPAALGQFQDPHQHLGIQYSAPLGTRNPAAGRLLERTMDRCRSTSHVPPDGNPDRDTVLLDQAVAHGSC